MCKAVGVRVAGEWREEGGKQAGGRPGWCQGAGSEGLEVRGRCLVPPLI